MRRTVVGVVCGLVLAVAGPAGATGEADFTRIGVDRLISNSAANEWSPQVAWNATANQYLVVWVDNRSEATRGTEIYGRRVGADGVTLGADFRISATTADEAAPQVVWNQTANQYLVIWQDTRSVGTRGTEIYGRRVGADGSVVGANFRISNSTANEYVPQVAWNATANQFLVVWRDSRSSGTRGGEIYGRRVGADGVTIGADFRISNSTADEFYPQVVWNAIANQYLVVWQDYRSDASRGREIYGRRVGADGATIGADFRISNSTANESVPQVVWNQTSNQYLVVWEDYRSEATRGAEIYGRRVGADGVVVGGNVRISGPNATADESAPQVVWNQAANQYLVVWEDYRNQATRGAEIYGRRFAGDPAP